MLEISNVIKVFYPGTVNEKIALSGLSLTVNDGDFVTVIGGNGAGKSTMLNVVSGALLPDAGKVLIDGKDVTNLVEYKRSAYMGRVFQDPMFGTAADMSIWENLSIASMRGKQRGFRYGISAQEKARFRDLLAELDLGLEDRMSAKVGLLSGGQRQAITLLMATMNSPRLLLLDEHTAALDPKTALKVLTLTAKIVGENDLTTLMITHNMSDAIRYGNRLIMMHDGNVVYDVSGEEKKNLTVPDLLERFGRVSPDAVSDRMALS